MLDKITLRDYFAGKALIFSLETFPSRELTEHAEYSYIIAGAMLSARGEEPKKEKRKNENYIPPSIHDVTQYCVKRRNNVVPEKFYDFYSSKGWMIGKNKMKCWKSAIHTWEKSSVTIEQKPVKQYTMFNPNFGKV